MINSDFLAAKPSFIEGIARIFDWAGTLNVYNSSATGEEADFLAISADWSIIGQDLLAVIEANMIETVSHQEESHGKEEQEKKPESPSV